MNPINYARGLLETYAEAVSSGVKAREAEARDMLSWVAGELEQVDAEALTVDARALYEAAKADVTEVLASKTKRAAKAAEPAA
jgi:hypothetical protein